MVSGQFSLDRFEQHFELLPPLRAGLDKMSFVIAQPALQQVRGDVIQCFSATVQGNECIAKTLSVTPNTLGLGTNAPRDFDHVFITQNRHRFILRNALLGQNTTDITRSNFFKCRAHSILTLAVRGRFYPERPSPKRRRGYPARSIASKLAPTGGRPVGVPEAEHANYYEGLPDPIEPNCAMASLNANQHCIAAVMTLSRFNAPCAMESRISAGKSAGSIASTRSIAPGRSLPIWCKASETVVSGKPTLSAI